MAGQAGGRDGSRDRTARGSAFDAGGPSVASHDLCVGTELSSLHGDVELYLSCAGRYAGPVLPPVREVRDPASGHLIRRRTAERKLDPLRQLITETLRFEVIDPAGTLIAAEETSWALRWIWRQEMAWLLELAGFEVVAHYADFDRAPPAYGREQLWVARRR